MPAARSKSTKSTTSKPYSHSGQHAPKPSSSRSPDVESFACRARWCGSIFTRRADMIKHVEAEHLGKRYYCTICLAVMKQDSNMSTHLNTHLSNHSTICSCGLGFTDPSAYTRHREASGHPKGVTHGKVRPAIMKGVRIQHTAGMALTHDMIAADSFVPPLFDTSYHLRGKPKPRGKEKYNPVDFTILVNAPPTLSAVQANGISFTDGPLAVQYQVEPSVQARTNIKVDELGIDVDYSYDIELAKEPWNDQVANANAYAEWHTLPSSHSGIGLTQSPLPYNPHPCPPPGTICDQNGVDFYDQSSVDVDFYDQNNISSFIPNNADLYRQQCRQSFSQAINSHPPIPSPPFTEPHVLPGYYPSQASYHALLSTPSPTYGMPAHQQPFVGAMAFGMRPPERPQYTQLQLPPVYWPNAQAQHPTLVAPF